MELLHQQPSRGDNRILAILVTHQSIHSFIHSFYNPFHIWQSSLGAIRLQMFQLLLYTNSDFNTYEKICNIKPKNNEVQASLHNLIPKDENSACKPTDPGQHSPRTWILWHI